MKLPILFPFLLFAVPLFSQNAQPERLLDFNMEPDGDGYKFTAVTPELMQKPGAPKAYWSYFWEFGDGDFSREENPTHLYAAAGEVTVSLDVTAHYDDGKKIKRKNRKAVVKPAARLAAAPLHDVFDRLASQMVALDSYSKPRAEEEIVLTLSYRNLGALTTDGRIHLFYNEKKYPARHFSLAEVRAHAGETADMSTSMLLPMATDPAEAWTALPMRHAGGLALSWNDPEPDNTIIQEMLNAARGAYREENAWRFSELNPGEKRNLFISLACTPGMLRDTNAFIHLEAVFAPFDPVVAPERFVYEIEIVGSHDPNAIAVSDNRVSYRTIGSKKLDYKIRFQNNGEGPASTVELKVEVPRGLKMTAMKPVDWYPKCPVCPKIPDTRGCLDTATLDDGLLFTFRNIYLPGSRQEGLTDRDSTAGFVTYRITAERNMPKRAFKSRAKIVFDKNPPIYTNYTATRFKPGISPGLKAGYGFSPDSLRNGYVFLGASLSPYKSWRLYPQIELLSGIRGRSATPDQILPPDSTRTVNSTGALIDTLTIVQTTRKGERGFISFEIPLLLRKNFSNAFGAGLGGSVRLFLENGKTEDSKLTQRFEVIGMEPPRKFAENTAVTSEPFRNTRFAYSLFGDLTFGSVRAGPNLGIRGGWLFNDGENPQPFVQISVELKL